MSVWQRWHLGSPWARWPLKVALFLAIVVLVLYPRIWLLPTWLARLADMNSVIQPDCPALARLETAVREQVKPGSTPRQTLDAVQRVVYQAVPYAWDWEVWGVIDYLPTTAEVFAKGREDCDGRAVVSASLLRRMGYQAWLVSDLKHCWVATPVGEVMSPGEGEKTFKGGTPGAPETRLHVTLGTLANLSRALGFGIAVFPLTREMIILAALCALTLQPRSSPRRRAVGCLLVLLALGLVRDSEDVSAYADSRPMLAWIGVGALLVGWLLLAVKAAGRRSLRVPPG